MKNIAFKADVEVRKLSNHLVRKTLVTKLKDSNQRRSANKVKQATQAIVHWQTTWKLTKQNGDRSHPSSVLRPRWRVASEFRGSHPVHSSFPIQHNHTPTPACQNVVHHFHGYQVTRNYLAGVDLFQESSN